MITAPPRVRTVPTRVLGTIGLSWALAYVPIHVYWALGGTSTPIGITGEQSGFRAANWGACVVIVGAGLTCLSLTRRWGAALPAGLRRGTAWVGGLFGLARNTRDLTTIDPDGNVVVFTGARPAQRADPAFSKRMRRWNTEQHAHAASDPTDGRHTGGNDREAP